MTDPMPQASEDVLDQIIAVRQGGATNMISLVGVQEDAHKRDFHELVVFTDQVMRLRGTSRGAAWIRTLNRAAEREHGLPMGSGEALRT